MFRIHGIAILPPATELNISIYSGSFNPGIPPQADPWYDHIPTSARVEYNNRTVNVWSYEINTTGSYPDEYFILLQYPSDRTINATAIFNLVPAGGNATGRPGPADSYLLTIDPIATHVHNESFTISGTTDIPHGDELAVEVYSPNQTLGPKGTDYNGAVGVVMVREVSQGKNTWSFRVNSPDLKPGDYKAVVHSYRFGASNETSFSVVSEENTVPSPQPAYTISNTTGSLTRGSPLPELCTIIAIGCVIMMAAQQRMRKK